MKTPKFDIFGEIVDSPMQGATSPADFEDFIESLPEDTKRIVLRVNSLGGSVFAGMQIAHDIEDLVRRGVEVVADVTAVAASIASVIVCACSKVSMRNGSFLMVHRPWSAVEGTAQDMEQEAAILKQIESGIVDAYERFFNHLTREQIEEFVRSETWITSSSAKGYSDRIIIGEEGIQKVAACLTPVKISLPKGLEIMKIGKTMDEEEKTEEKTEEKVEEKTEEKVEEKTEEEIESLRKRIEELEKLLSEAEERANDRVRGMQSSMQINLNNKVSEIDAQLKARTAELEIANQRSTDLQFKLDEVTEELREKASALCEKDTALAALTANVNTPNEVHDWHSLSGVDFWNYLKANRIH
jgi:ATP-dependent Clp protease, protease subunit